MVCRWAHAAKKIYKKITNDRCANTLVAVQSNTAANHLKPFFFWLISCCGMKRNPLCDLEGLGVGYKRRMNCLCFPSCLFKYWNTKSFRREMRCCGPFAEQMRFSLHKKKRKNNKFFSNPRVCVGVCLCCECKACWDRFLQSGSPGVRFNAWLMSNLKVHGKTCGRLIECFYIHACCCCNSGSCPI